MSTMQSNNRKNIFVQRENNHNLFSLCYFLLSTLLIFIFLLLASIKGFVPIIIYLSFIFVLVLFKLIWQFKLIASFNNLINKINKENIPFYISKSWKRKRESTIWIGLSALFFTIYTLIITLSLSSIGDYKSSIIIAALFLSFFIFIILITMYANIQILDSNLKQSVKKINFHSIEWEQILKEQKMFFKTIFIIFIHILLILPLILLLIPAYKRVLKKIIKN